MCGFDEIEVDLKAEKTPKLSPEQALRTGEKEETSDEEPIHKPQLQWSWEPFREATQDLLGLILASVRAFTRYTAKG